MARIALLDGDAVKHARSADFMTPDLADIRHARAHQLALEHGRAHDGAITRHLIRTAAERRDAQDNRIIAVINRLNIEHRLGAVPRRVVSGPLAERSFVFANIVV